MQRPGLAGIPVEMYLVRFLRVFSAQSGILPVSMSLNITQSPAKE